MTYERSRRDVKKGLETCSESKSARVSKSWQKWAKRMQMVSFQPSLWRRCSVLLKSLLNASCNTFWAEKLFDFGRSKLGAIWAQKPVRAFSTIIRSAFKQWAVGLSHRFILLTLTTSSSEEEHLTASEMSVTEASMPTVTTFTGTATVFPVRTAVFNISESCRQEKEKGRHQYTGPVAAVRRKWLAFGDKRRKKEKKKAFRDVNWSLQLQQREIISAADFIFHDCWQMVMHNDKVNRRWAKWCSVHSILRTEADDGYLLW